MAEIFLISDTHFGHRKILEFEKQKRPFSCIEEHDQFLVEQWNAAVSRRDTVIHLGDVLFRTESFQILPRLNGIKKLVLGNHDTYPTASYLRHFNKVLGSMRMGKNILTHIPIHPSQFYRFDTNIHGHVHSQYIQDSRYINVSAEMTGLKPIAISELRDMYGLEI